MISTYSQNKQIWTDISSPTKDELDSLIMAQNLDPLIAKDLNTPTPKQYTKKFDNSVYIVLHIPFFKHSSRESLEQEIDFIISKDGLITTRYDSIDALHHYSKYLEANETFNKPTDSHIFVGLMKEVYKFLFDEIEYMKDWTKEIEKRIFQGKEKDMVFSLSEASRNILVFQRNIKPHGDVFKKMMEFSKDILTKDFEKDMTTLVEEWNRLIIETQNTKDMLDELKETNNSLLSTKQNEVMKIFTILAFVTFPLSLIASIFGMNTSFIPLMGVQNDFWIVIGIMFFVSIAMFAYFKYKRWI